MRLLLSLAVCAAHFSRAQEVGWAGVEPEARLVRPASFVEARTTARPWQNWAEKGKVLGKGAYGSAFEATVTNPEHAPPGLELTAGEKVVIKTFHTRGDAMLSESANVAPYIKGIQQLDQQLDSGDKDRFLFQGREALMTIRANATRDQNYMVYEHCSGVTLKEWLPALGLNGDMDDPNVPDPKDDLRFALAVKIVRHLLAAVYALGEGGLRMSHRDIKPPNIQVQVGLDEALDLDALDAPGAVKLLDPGLLLNTTTRFKAKREHSGTSARVRQVAYDSPFEDYFYAPPEANLGTPDFTIYAKDRPYLFDVFSIGTNFLAMLTGVEYPRAQLTPICKLGVPEMKDPGPDYNIKQYVSTKAAYDSALAELPYDFRVYDHRGADRPAADESDLFVRGDTLRVYYDDALAAANVIHSGTGPALVGRLFDMLHPKPDERPNPSELLNSIDNFFSNAEDWRRTKA